MQNLAKILSAVVLAGYFAACAPVRFEQVATSPSAPPTKVDSCADSSCIVTANSIVHKGQKIVGRSMVDILIVDDNSGSMSPIQAEMANRFPQFLNSLGELDYRIGIVTTDIGYPASTTGLNGNKANVAGPYNGNGKLQDGKLIEFTSGVSYLEPTTTNKEALFNATIQRNETINCEKSNFQNCPSDDERGIFAANLALSNASALFRPLAHLAVVFLSNEDERGMVDPSDANYNLLKSVYPTEEFDKPDVFVHRFHDKFPGKTLSVHPIIVNDVNCRTQQTDASKNITGKIGYAYQSLQKVAGGTVGDICATDYTAQLQEIGKYLQKQTVSVPSSCAQPEAISIRLNGGPDISSDDYTLDAKNQIITINSPQDPLTTVSWEIKCPPAN